MSIDERVDQGRVDRAAVVRARWLRGALALTMVGVVGVVIALAPAPPASDAGGPVPAWRHEVSGVLSVVAIMLVTAGLVFLVRGHADGGRYDAQIRRFSRDQRRCARRRVRRGQAGAGEVGEAATLIAQMLVRRNRSGLVSVGIMVNALGLTIDTTSSQRVVVGGVVVIVMVVLLIIQLIDARSARRWLRTHAPSAPA